MPVRTAHQVFCVSVIKISHLILCIEITALYFEITTEHINTFSGQKA